MPWTAEPYLRTDKPERSDVALVQPGDGLDPEKYPFALRPVMHLMSPKTARALAAALIRAAEMVEAHALTGEVVAWTDCKPGEFYIATGAEGWDGPIPFKLSTAHYDGCRAMSLRCTPVIWGFSVYRRQPGYRTLGANFDEWMARPEQRNVVIRRDYDRVAAHKNRKKEPK